MKTKHLKAAAAAVSLLIASGPALATSTGTETLGAAATAVDAFTFSCPVGTVSARARVADIYVLNFFPTPPSFFNVPAQMQVILTKLALFPPAAATAVDVNPVANGGEGQEFPAASATPSAYAVVSGGSGLYRAMFRKTAAGTERYIGDIECVLFGGIVNPVLTDPPQWNQ